MPTLKLLFSVLPLLFAKPRSDTSHNLRIDFLNVAGVCQKTIQESDMASIDWANQYYVLKKEVDLNKFSLFDGSINIYFRNALILTIRIEDKYSSRAHRNDVPATLSSKGRLLDEKGGFQVAPPHKPDPAWSKYLANKEYIAYLTSKKIIRPDQ